MTWLPEVIGPVFPTGDGHQLAGILNVIKTTYTNDPLSENIVKVEASALPGTLLNNIITWNGDFATNYDANSVIISFPNRHLFPTNYSLKPPTATNFCYQKKWSVYGYNEGESGDQSKWTKLHDGESTDNIFCGTGQHCVSKGISTYPLQTFKVPRSFQYIKFISTESSCYEHFSTGGIDIYGWLTFDNRFPTVEKPPKCTCFNSSNVYKIPLCGSIFTMLIILLNDLFKYSYILYTKKN